MITGFDILLSTAAVLIMLTGFIRLAVRCHRGRPEGAQGNLGNLLRFLLAQARILKRPVRGLAHQMVFWGVVIPLALVIYAQFGLGMPYTLAAIFSLLTDCLGAVLLAGVVFFLLRPRGSASPGLPAGSLLPALLLLFIVISGFLAEGSRLAVAGGGPIWHSPLGWMVALIAPASPLFMQAMIRLHFLAVLVFVASVPFGFMRHLVAASMNIYYSRPERPRGAMRPVSLQAAEPGAQSIGDLTWKQLLEAEACVSCGRCQENCPAYLSGKPLSPRKVMQALWGQQNMRQAAKGQAPLLLDGIGADEMWACTTCQACVEQCPVFIDPMDKLISMRRFQTMSRGALPAEARPLIRNLELYGDSYGKGPALREDWAMGCAAPRAYGQVDGGRALLWAGCAGAFHPRYQQVTRAMVRILQAAKVPFVIAGKEELCCGDPARRLGQEDLFQDLARRNIESLEKRGVTTVVAACPHCFNTLRNEYPSLGAGFEAVPAVEFIARLINEGSVIPKYPVEAVLTIHDPCYLGRVNQIYDCLRQVAASLPGVTLKELAQSRENAFCCGGGGGRMWLHESQGRGINKMRAQQVAEAGVELVATACPYCLTMLEDGLNDLDVPKPPRSIELIELVADSI
ncbi:MAG: (Fe-S)-binding protein [Deltaproteobacteria bacterium]|nr:(Fe-S)-binding protein [Deltaproteobacteria bacterium]